VGGRLAARCRRRVPDVRWGLWDHFIAHAHQPAFEHDHCDEDGTDGPVGLVFVGLDAGSSLAVLGYQFLDHQSERLHVVAGEDGDVISTADAHKSALAVATDWRSCSAAMKVSMRLSSCCLGLGGNRSIWRTRRSRRG